MAGRLRPVDIGGNAEVRKVFLRDRMFSTSFPQAIVDGKLQ
jgi:hypothetical protein